MIRWLPWTNRDSSVANGADAVGIDDFDRGRGETGRQEWPTPLRNCIRIKPRVHPVVTPIHKNEYVPNYISRNTPYRLLIILVLFQTVSCKDDQTLQNRKIWSRWSKWGDCSVTCGDGIVTRYRVCVSGRCAPGEREEQRRPCARAPCHAALYNVTDEPPEVDNWMCIFSFPIVLHYIFFINTQSN